jgi:amino acid transporter
MHRPPPNSADAIYPVLFLDYALQIWTPATENVHPILRYILLSSTSIGLAYVNWLGLNVVGNMSIVICILSMTPFLIMGVIGAFQVDPQRWLGRPESDGSVAGWDEDKDTRSDMVYGGILWRPFLNNLFWNLNSFDSAASFAGDVQDPGRLLPVAMFWSIILVVLGYLIPLLSALGATDSLPHDWVDGYLATAASQIGGRWLGAWVVFSAGVSNVALFLAELSTDAFQLMGMSERGFVPKIFAQRSRHGTPTYSILLGLGFVIVLMSVANLDKLIEMLNFNYAISLLMEYAAFLKLRISKPEGMPFERVRERERCLPESCFPFLLIMPYLTHFPYVSFSTKTMAYSFGDCWLCLALLAATCCDTRHHETCNYPNNDL